MFEILPPLFIRGDMFGMREFLGGTRYQRVLLTLKIDDRFRWFHGYCDLADHGLARGHAWGPVVERESRLVHAMSAQEKVLIILEKHDRRRLSCVCRYARFPASIGHNRQIALVYPRRARQNPGSCSTI